MEHRRTISHISHWFNCWCNAWGYPFSLRGFPIIGVFPDSVHMSICQPVTRGCHRVTRSGWAIYTEHMGISATCAADSCEDGLGTSNCSNKFLQNLATLEWATITSACNTTDNEDTQTYTIWWVKLYTIRTKVKSLNYCAPQLICCINQSVMHRTV
jgi:hypothetical protein